MTREELEAEKKFEAEQNRRQADKENYPWICYMMFGWHSIQFLTEREAKGTIRFYKLQKHGSAWIRNGKQSIHMCRRDGNETVQRDQE